MTFGAARVSTAAFAAIARNYLTDEGELVRGLADAARLNEAARRSISEQAGDTVEKIRRENKTVGAIDALLLEYGLSTEEGVALMRLSEALIRTPDFVSSHYLIRDKLANGAWSSHAGTSENALVNIATTGLQLTSAWFKATGGVGARNLVSKLGDSVLLTAVGRAMAMMGDHFVLGSSIESAVSKAKRHEPQGYTHSYDMLGEAAHTQADADRYFDSYMHAVRVLARTAKGARSAAQTPGISVKLSALHPRYEFAKREECVPALVEKLREISIVAKSAGIGMNIDAEEADRLEVSLLIFSELLRDPALEGWDGLGFVVQAYQRRALNVLEWLKDEVAQAGRRVCVRLVKGAYWDMEIKRAQEMGLESYPVFTRKENTDVSYLACARFLLDAGDLIYPQFATHNAHTMTAILQMAGDRCNFEFQRLHGMGEALHDVMIREAQVRSRVYAPVGVHEDLLPYLVRRLLENGANSSFVNQLLDNDVPVASIVGDPIARALSNDPIPHPSIPSPRDLFGGERLSAEGLDLTQSSVAFEYEERFPVSRQYMAACLIDGEEIGDTTVEIANPAKLSETVGIVRTASVEAAERAIVSASQSQWGATFTPSERAACLRRAADQLEREMPDFIDLCVSEAGKTMPDAVAEVREAVDFCRYYADQAMAEKMSSRAPLGVVACISPWNFPLAIFLGQVVASLAAGNAVVAKPAEQTPLIAFKAVKLLHAAGVPPTALQLVLGAGEIGAALTSHEKVNGVCFTGSTDTAKRIAASLARTGRAHVPLIAETGGLNVMIVDSTALIEQAVQDVVDSAFQSAGQRCSACRIVCVQDCIADKFITMLSGAMDELALGDPSKLSTDVGPVIDAEAHDGISDYITDKRKQFGLIGEAATNVQNADGWFVQPIAFSVGGVSDVEREIFGPVLHVARFRSEDLDTLISEINGLGYGLTMGLHTRIDARVERVARRAHVGNLYVNRNQIGAVVGVQPFGGEGLSGTGPKAGGPNYLLRLTKQAGAVYGETSSATKAAATVGVAPNPAKAVLADSRLGQKQWDTEFSEEKARRMAALLGETSLPAVLTPLPVTLPGPTGEKNTLTYYPRGVMVCFGGDAPQDLERQILKALATRNSVIVVAGEGASSARLDEIVAGLTSAGVPKNAVLTASRQCALTLLGENIEGVVADGAQRAEIAPVLALRDGAIIPLLSSDDDPVRFCHERTLTINTTAAGGNASLLAMT